MCSETHKNLLKNSEILAGLSCEGDFGWAALVSSTLFLFWSRSTWALIIYFILYPT